MLAFKVTIMKLTKQLTNTILTTQEEEQSKEENQRLGPITINSLQSIGIVIELTKNNGVKSRVKNIAVKNTNLISLFG